MNFKLTTRVYRSPQIAGVIVVQFIYELHKYEQPIRYGASMAIIRSEVKAMSGPNPARAVLREMIRIRGRINSPEEIRKCLERAERGDIKLLACTECRMTTEIDNYDAADADPGNVRCNACGSEINAKEAANLAVEMWALREKE